MKFYQIFNKNHELILQTTDKTEAETKLEKGLKRGWKWTLESFTVKPTEPEWWEMAGYKQDPTKVNYGHSLLEHFG